MYQPTPATSSSAPATTRTIPAPLRPLSLEEVRVVSAAGGTTDGDVDVGVEATPGGSPGESGLELFGGVSCDCDGVVPVVAGVAGVVVTAGVFAPPFFADARAFFPAAPAFPVFEEAALACFVAEALW
jgi:hypothetical protein